VLHPISKLEFIKVFPKVFKGTHISHPAVEIVRSKKVSITADAVAYADGERIGQLPVSAECISGALSTWMP
jgi:diacylglycerol kinase (ATP)